MYRILIMTVYLFLLSLLTAVLGSENIKNDSTRRVVTYVWSDSDDDANVDPKALFEDIFRDMGLFLGNSNQGSGINSNPSFRNFGNDFPNFSFRPRSSNAPSNKHRINSWDRNYGQNNGRGRVNHGNYRSRNRQFLPSHLQHHQPQQQRWRSTHQQVHSSGGRNFGKTTFDNGRVDNRNSYGQFNRKPNSYSSFNADNEFNRRGSHGFDNVSDKTDRSSFPYGLNARNAFKSTNKYGPNSRSFNIENSFKKGNTYGHNKSSGWSNSYSTSWKSGQGGSNLSDVKKQFDEVFKNFP